MSEIAAVLLLSAPGPPLLPKVTLSPGWGSGTGVTKQLPGDICPQLGSRNEYLSLWFSEGHRFHCISVVLGENVKLLHMFSLPKPAGWQGRGQGQGSLERGRRDAQTPAGLRPEGHEDRDQGPQLSLTHSCATSQGPGALA